MHFDSYLCRKIVLVHSTFLLAATGASKFGQTKATADSRQFGLIRWGNGLAPTDAFLLMD